MIGELASTQDEALATRLFRTLARKDIPLDAIEKSLKEYAANMGSGDGDERAAKERTKVAALVEALERRRVAEAAMKN